ncbi:MAG: tetratricopeptide repeat protein [Pirellulaceae bacterium]|nr:tetratricopeptide repeat protein [Pirellulaceae bacterium]
MHAALLGGWLLLPCIAQPNVANTLESKKVNSMVTRTSRTAGDSTTEPAQSPTLQLYSPAMMAQMLGISVRAIRLWYRAGLIQSTQVVHKIPYFDYAMLSTAKTLSQWLKQGLTTQSIVQQITALRRLPGVPAQSLGSLPILLDGKRLVLELDSQQVDATGQIHFGFTQNSERPTVEVVTLKFVQPAATQPAAPLDSLAGMLEAAEAAEDRQDLDEAVDCYRAILTQFGPDAEICFQLAEVMYRQGDLGGARERYFMAIELDPMLVEARANLGCVLAECGRPQLAVAAFQGALALYPDYADVHFLLARTLDELDQQHTATQHWQRFIELAPASSWADEARARLSRQPSLEL